MGLLGLLALCVGLIQVIGRYLDPANAIGYAEEVIVYLVIWAIMIVSSQLVRTDGHVRPDLVLRLLPTGAQRWVEMFNCLLAIVFCAGMVWYGWEIVDTAQLIDERSSTDLQFPMWIYYARAAGGRRADGGALCPPIAPLPVRLRPGQHDRRARNRGRNAERHAREGRLT